MTFVRAKHSETGHVAALPEDALALGMCPGWLASEGPVPNGPKVSAFDKKSEPDKTGEKPDTGEQKPPEIADTTSAKKTRS